MPNPNLPPAQQPNGLTAANMPPTQPNGLTMANMPPGVHNLQPPAPPANPLEDMGYKTLKQTGQGMTKDPNQKTATNPDEYNLGYMGHHAADTQNRVASQEIPDNTEFHKGPFGPVGIINLIGNIAMPSGLRNRILGKKRYRGHGPTA